MRFSALRRVALIATVAAAVPFPGRTAAIYGSGLGRVDSVRLVVGDVGDAGRTCGLSADGLRTSIGDPLEDGPLKVVAIGAGADPDTAVDLSVRTENTTLLDGAVCASALSVEVNLATQALVNGKAVASQVVLWATGTVVTSGHDEHVKRVREAVEKAAKELLADWSEARGPRT